MSATATYARDTDDTDALLHRCAGGDRAAFRLLYDRWGGRLYGIALRITRQAALAADATQDAFVQIWQQAHRFDPDDREDETPDALARLVSSAEGAALHRCLGALEADRRRLVVMAFVDGLSHSDLAARMGVPLGTVKSWIRRSLISLRECLAA
jgi:RNA polymerase sigma-70 factor, ECF subfamily